jgi:mRNA interferase MazF
MNRGDVWSIDLGGKAETRPIVILTRQAVLRYLNKVTVAEITTKGKGYPTEVFIDQKANLSKPSFVRTDSLHTVPKQRLQKYMGTLDPDTIRKISQKIVLALELEEALFDNVPG